VIRHRRIARIPLALWSATPGVYRVPDGSGRRKSPASRFSTLLTARLRPVAGDVPVGPEDGMVVVRIA